MKRTVQTPTGDTSSHDSRSWRRTLRSAVRDPDELVDRLGLPEAFRAGARRAAEAFSLVVPEPYLARIRPEDPSDPLLRQVLPLDAECGPVGQGFGPDPVGDLAAIRTPGVLQKYQGRALLMVARTCAVACRYCFRRHFPYSENPGGLEQWEPALEAIAQSPDLEEIILSGGDPLMQSDSWLGALVERLEQIPHLRRLRVHTRLPIVIPDRVTDELISWLGGSRLAPTFVVHANHAAELDEACCEALLRLVRSGVPVLNQAVLLRGVNDEAEALIDLSKRLLDLRVMPYYLHQLDAVAGASHFEVPVERGLELIATMRKQLPGFGVPRYVREVAGVAHKVEL